MALTATLDAAPDRDLDKMFRSAKQASGLLKSLSHENRLLILCILSEGEKSVSELEDILGMRQPAISQQLARLRVDGLVDTRRDGKTVYYRNADEAVQKVIAVLYDIYCRTDAP